MHGFDDLELSTETLRELSGGELEQVAGGAQPPTLYGCLTGAYTHWCPTFNGCIYIEETLLCS